MACMVDKCIPCLWEHLKERDYVECQIMLKLIWNSWVDGRGEGLSGVDTSGMRGSSSEHEAFSILVYTGDRLALCSSRITPCETASCVHCLGHRCPGYEHGRPSFCRQSRGHPLLSHSLYQATTADMMSCTNYC